jgi:hypothetical protein
MQNEGSFTAPAPVASGDADSTAATGTLALHAVLRMESKLAVCPAGTPSSAIECYSREGRGVVSGLGEVSESYIFVPAATNPAECPGGGPVKILGNAARFTVSGKGEIELVMAESQNCLSPVAALTATQAFTVTGGSGAYAGASGNGTLRRTASQTPTGAIGTDTWVGTLVVPGLEFDVTAPTLGGAVGKTVPAPKGKTAVRVTYKVTARDNVDGVVPVSCQPTSGRRFTIGRTTVSCSTLDTSGNSGIAKFRITVKATP